MRLKLVGYNSGRTPHVSAFTARSPGSSGLSSSAISVSRDRRLWAGVAALLFPGHVIYLSCVAEDAFIAFSFAKNLASGHGLVWNPGEPPVEGYTDFLWVLLSAAAIRLGLSVIDMHGYLTFFERRDSVAARGGRAIR